MQLDLQTRTTGSFAGCLRPALRAAGVDWSLEHLRGYLGPAFAFSMKPDGGHLNQADNYEWFYFYDMLDFLEHESVSVALKGSWRSRRRSMPPPRPGPGRWSAAPSPTASPPSSGRP